MNLPRRGRFIVPTPIYRARPIPDDNLPMNYSNAQRGNIPIILSKILQPTFPIAINFPLKLTLANVVSCEYTNW